MSRNNLTFGYVLFVGIPLLILIGTLRAGAKFSAPPAISGDWAIEPMPNKCAGPLADVSPPTMNIYQTGADLLVAFNDPPKTTLAGHLENGHIAATSSTSGRGAALRLEAALNPEPGHRSMQGRLFFDGCNTCAPVPFRAIKSGK